MPDAPAVEHRPLRALAAVPAWRWWVAGSFLARLPATMVVLALVLSGKRLDSYGLGAALAGLYTVAAGVSALWRGRALDRRELRRGIVGQLLATASAFAVTAVLVQVDAPVLLVGAAVLAAGVSSSSVMAGYRAFLPDVVAAGAPAGQGRGNLIQPAFAIDAVLLEVGFVVGPALAGGLALVVGPVGVLWAMAGLGLVAAGVGGARLPERHPVTAAAVAAPPPWADRAVVANYVVTFAVGMLIGLLEAGFAPFAVVLGAEDGVGGLCSAAYALGSGIGGMVFATRLTSRSSSGRQALVLVSVLALLLVPVALAPSIPWLLVLLLLAGLPFATTNAAAASHLQARVHPARATEGFALVTASVFLGLGAGSGVASLALAADASPRLLYVLGAVPPLLAAAGVAAWAGGFPGFQRRVDREASTRQESTVADIQDPIAASKNAKAKEEAEAVGSKFNYTKAFDKDDSQGVMGSDPDKVRAGPGQGIRADFAQDTGGQAQTSVFDGKGNESVVVFGQNAEGQPAQGTGPDVASAEAEVADGDASDPGSAFGNLNKE